MTNADKAFELLNKLDFEDGKYEITDALIDMGEWKDAQIATQKQALIDKACDFLSRAIDEWNDQERHRTFYLDKDGCLRNFKKAMER